MMPRKQHRSRLAHSRAAHGTRPVDHGPERRGGSGLSASAGRAAEWTLVALCWLTLGQAVLALDLFFQGDLPPVLRDESEHFHVEQSGDGWHIVSVDDRGMGILARLGVPYEQLDQEPGQRSGYLSLAEIQQRLQEWTETYPLLCRLRSIGNSVQLRPLHVMRVTDYPDYTEFEPQVKMVASMHGNEPVAADICLRFIRFLLEQYDTRTDVRAFVDATDIQVLPVMNPDGYVLGTRNNANPVPSVDRDLNRSFPHVYDPDNTGSGRQPETAAVMAWTAANRFALSAGFHSGYLGVVYPWGHQHDNDSPLEQNPEMDLFLRLSLMYTAENTDMWPLSSDGRYHGTINGLDMYPVLGEMPDWNYRFHGCLEVTVELSYPSKAPANLGFDQPWSLWDNNREAMLAYYREAHRGVRGHVRTTRIQPVQARIGVGRIEGVGDRAADVRARCYLPLKAGWNLVSLPLQPDAPSVASVFPHRIGPCWEWTVDGFARAQVCTPNRGLWVYCRTDVTETVEGALVVDDPIPVVPGWNLVGPHGHTIWLPDGRGATELVGWNATAGAYESIAEGTRLEPTRAYWLFATAGTTSIDLAEGPNRPFPTRSDASGAYFRVLAEGTYALSFEDETVSAIQHAPPATLPSGAFTLEASYNAQAFPRQVFGLAVPAGDAPDGLPNRLQEDVFLDVGDPICQLHYSFDAGQTWYVVSMDDPQQDGGAETPFPGWPFEATELTYYFRLLREPEGEVIATLGEEAPYVAQREGLRLSVRGESTPTAEEDADTHTPVTGTIEGTSRSWSGRILNDARR